MLNAEKLTQRLWNAVQNNAVTEIEACRKQGMNLNVIDADGNTPLLLAVQNGYLEAAIALLNLSVDARIRDQRYGKTAEEWAQDYPVDSPIRLALKNWRLRRKFHPCEYFCFCLACTQGSPSVIAAFAEQDMELNHNVVIPMPPGFPQELPLIQVVRSGSVRSAKILLDWGADPDAISRKCDLSARQVAAKEKKTKLLKLFETYQKDK